MTRETALITGASRGLGRALAGELARDGWNLIIDARGGDALAAAATELSGLGAGTVAAIAGDVGDAAHRAALARAAAAAGGLDLLVNNASVLGTVPLPRLADQPLDDLAEAFRINTLAPLALIQAVLPALRERRGAVLNVTSDAAVEGYPTWGGYGSTKAALEQLSNVLAAEEPGIAVWWVDPGEMRTGMLRDAGEDVSSAAPPEDVAAALRRLVGDRPGSGRLRAADLMPAVDGRTR
ncbi:SDR family oxidoreductase [Actinomadura sp. NPDC047616]|uniref:SDR family NAD(P)-dependent oxidoreductase n=1 Tax=Actinomadura sp. NPDC047616 TaxID=3155914 RepID=UPI0033FA8BC8